MYLFAAKAIANPRAERRLTMYKPENVPLSGLATLLERIVTGYQQRGVANVDLSKNDLYRVFETGEMFDVYAGAPTVVSIGSLHDDMTELSKLLADQDRIPTAVDIERLGNVLRAVAEIV